MQFPLVQKIFGNTFTSAEAEAEQWRNDPASKNRDKKTIIVCIATALCLTFSKYLVDPSYLYSFLHLFGAEMNWSLQDLQFYQLTWWVAILMIFYFIVPVLVIKLLFREELSNYGLKLKGAFKDYYLYIIMLVIMIPLVLFFSRTESFQARYPFYNLDNGEALSGNFLMWEIMYFLQFCGLEFFFRGFIVHGTKHRFGYYSVFVMTIPYCMIHFGKPLPETIAAIIAGVVLGTLSLKSRSIWLGIAIHYTVAIAMDLAALWQKGLL